MSAARRLHRGKGRSRTPYNGMSRSPRRCPTSTLSWDFSLLGASERRRLEKFWDGRAGPARKHDPNVSVKEAINAGRECPKRPKEPAPAWRTGGGMDLPPDEIELREVPDLR